MQTLGMVPNTFLLHIHMSTLLLTSPMITRNWLDMHIDASPQQIERQYERLFANKGR